jgi:hypothetical protein
MAIAFLRLTNHSPTTRASHDVNILCIRNFVITINDCGRKNKNKSQWFVDPAHH